VGHYNVERSVEVTIIVELRANKTLDNAHTAWGPNELKANPTAPLPAARLRQGPAGDPARCARTVTLLGVICVHLRASAVEIPT
jgi:hypothetical protein